MAGYRKSEAQKREEWSRAESLEWESFKVRLEAAQGFVDAHVLHGKAPPESAPGRRYYSNLGAFLMTFAPPAGANRTELRMYLDLFRRIKQNDPTLLKPGTTDHVEPALEQAIADSHW